MIFIEEVAVKLWQPIILKCILKHFHWKEMITELEPVSMAKMTDFDRDVFYNDLTKLSKITNFMS